MKIKACELFKVPPRWLFLRLETDDGFVGWGEPVVEGRADTVEAAVHELEPYFMGKDPRDVESIWQTVYRGGFYRGGPVLNSALSGIDQALWDIKGKDLGVPVYQLIGGKVRDRMRVYSWINSDTPEQAAACAAEKKADGFSAVKMIGVGRSGFITSHAEMDKLLGKIQAIRDKVGFNLEIAVDFHGRVHKAMARELLRELEPFKLLFVEEPVLIENEEAFAELHRFSPIPLATGERCFSRWDFKRLLTSGSVDIIQPDLCHAGGISEVRRIAAMAEAFDVALAPHCPLGPVALASCLQVDFASINACIQEQSIGMAYNKGKEIGGYIKNTDVFLYKGGYAGLFTLPGLGVEVDEDSVREAAKTGHHWKNPVFTLDDGSVAEW
jgi:galactonate dehydratase